MLRDEVASPYALGDDTERAVAELVEARRLVSDDRYSNIAWSRPLMYSGWSAPKIRALAESIYFAGLRKAGVPEE
jgi:hypothetical protein